MKFFRGDRTFGTFHVHVCEGDPDALSKGYVTRPLRNVRHESSPGFSWGCVGNGTDDLALAICSEILGHNAKTRDCQIVAEELIVPLDPDNGWTIPWTRVLDSMARANGAAGSGLGQVRL